MYYVLDVALHGLVLLNPFVVGNIVIRHVDEEIGIYRDGLPCLGEEAVELEFESKSF